MEKSVTTLTFLLMSFIFSSASPTNNILTQNQDLQVAIGEMQKANYFAFVMLINMSPLSQKTLQNITFLMPKDKMLSTAIIRQNTISDFLLRHSIPSPLLFEHLAHIPTGAMIPSSKPEYMLRITNGGRRSYFLNNVKIISPNICTAGSSIRCHGIDGVLAEVKPPESNNTQPVCSGSTSSGATIPAVSHSPSPAPAHALPDQSPAPAPDGGRQQKSGSSVEWMCHRSVLVQLSVTLLVVSMIGVFT